MSEPLDKPDDAPTKNLTPQVSKPDSPLGNLTPNLRNLTPPLSKKILAQRSLTS